MYIISKYDIFISFPYDSEDDDDINVDLQANCRDTVRRLLSSKAATERWIHPSFVEEILYLHLGNLIFLLQAPL